MQYLPKSSIARVWKGTARDVAAYLRHLDENVVPELKAIAGYQGLRVLRMDREITVMTFWDSMESVQRFAGDHAERAVVEPEAQAVLERYDDFVIHYEVER